MALQGRVRRLGSFHLLLVESDNWDRGLSGDHLEARGRGDRGLDATDSNSGAQSRDVYHLGRYLVDRRHPEDDLGGVLISMVLVC